MAITCTACGHWSLNGEHACPAVWAEHMAQAARPQLVIQLPDKPGMEYDDLLIALTMLAQKLARQEPDPPRDER
jgi:hypothetical protein